MDEPMPSLSERFARRNDPPHNPSKVLYVVGEADRSYLQNVAWDPAGVGLGGNPAGVAWERYEMLVAKARRQLPDQGLQDMMWGYDKFGRIVILAQETYRKRPGYFVEWPSSLPEAPYPDDAHIVGTDVLSEQLGERPVYIRYPSGALDLLPVMPSRRIVEVPPFKWGYRGTGPDCLASAIEYSCCSDILDKAPGRGLRRARTRLDAAIKDDPDPWGIGITLESVIEKTPAGEILEIRIGQIRDWYAKALAEELRPPWGTDLPPLQ
jgi:hypothetical protein